MSDERRRVVDSPGNTSVVKRRFIESAVICTLWWSFLLAPWLEEWSSYSLPKMYGDNQIDVEINDALVTTFKCVVTITLAVSVDLNGQKYFSYVVCLWVVSMTPLIGIIVHNTQIPGSALALPLGISFLFICAPVMYSLMFSQNLQPGWKWSRWLISTLMLITLANGIIEYSVIPHGPLQFENIDKVMHLTLIPVILAGVSLIVILPLTTFMKKFIKPEILTERTLKEVILGLKTDFYSSSETLMFHLTKSTIKFGLFLSLFVPTLSLLWFQIYIFRLGADEDTNVNVHNSTMQWFLLSQIIALVGIEVLMSPLLFLSLKAAKFLTLLLPYLMTFVVAVLVYCNFSEWERGSKVLELVPLEEGVDRHGRLLHNSQNRSTLERTAIPSEGTRVLEFYNTIPSDAPINVTSPYFKLNGLQYNQRYLAVLTSCANSFVITVSSSGGTLNRKIYTAPEKLHSYVIVGDATYGIQDVIAVMGHNGVRPRRRPILIIMNTFIPEGEEFKHQVRIEHVMTGHKEVFHASSLNYSKQVKSFPGLVTIAYEHIATNDTVMLRHAFQLVEIETHSVYTILIEKSDGSVQIVDFLVMQGAEARSLTEELAFSEVPQGPVVDAVFSLLGGSVALAQNSYTHFMWTDGPRRMRTTLIAVFQVVGTIVYASGQCSVNRLDETTAGTMLAVQCFVILWMLVALYLYFFHFRFSDRSKPQNEDDDAAKQTSQLESDTPQPNENQKNEEIVQ